MLYSISYNAKMLFKCYHCPLLILLIAIAGGGRSAPPAGRFGLREATTAPFSQEVTTTMPRPGRPEPVYYCIISAEQAEKTTCHRLSRRFRWVSVLTSRSPSSARSLRRGLLAFLCRKQSSLGWGGDKAHHSCTTAVPKVFLGDALAPRLALESSWKAPARVFSQHRGVSHDSSRPHWTKHLQ